MRPLLQPAVCCCAVSRLRAAGVGYYMEEWIKTVKAQEQAKHDGISIAASEVRARISDSYIKALEAYKAAIFEDERRRFLRSAAEAKLEAFRTQEATRRAEGKGYQ